MHVSSAHLSSYQQWWWFEQVRSGGRCPRMGFPPSDCVSFPLLSYDSWTTSCRSVSNLQPRHLSCKTLKQWSVCIFVLAVMSLTMKCESCCGSILIQDGCRSRHCWPQSRAQHPHSQGRPHLKHQETVSEQQEIVSNQKCSNEHFMWLSKTIKINVH